jgi:uncharacterized 2Fe-2S/4Fe-4S cluster protein (DUF4445 family)
VKLLPATYEVWGVVLQTNGLMMGFRLRATKPASEGRIVMEGIIPVTGSIAHVEIREKGDAVKIIQTDRDACVAGQEFTVHLTMADMP